MGEDRDNPWTDPTAPVVAGEPVVTGAAKDNFKILWAEGKSTFGIVYLAEQVEGQAVVTIPTRLKNGGGESSVKLIINFAKYAGAGRYESIMPNRSVDFKMVDSLEVALENGNLNFEQVSVAPVSYTHLNGEKVPVDDQFSVTTKCLTMNGEEIPREVMGASVMNMDFEGV